MAAFRPLALKTTLAHAMELMPYDLRIPASSQLRQQVLLHLGLTLQCAANVANHIFLLCDHLNQQRIYRANQRSKVAETITRMYRVSSTARLSLHT